MKCHVVVVSDLKYLISLSPPPLPYGIVWYGS